MTSARMWIPALLVSVFSTPSLALPFMWIRNAALDPDWLRVGTDIVGGATPPTFNAAFSLTGDAVPEPATDLLLLMAAGAAIPFFRCRVSACRA